MQDLATTPTASVAPLYLHLSVTDPETVTALSEATEGRDRQELALTALKIGILSLKAARGTVDGAVIRHEGERLVGSLEQRLAGHRALLDEQLGGVLRAYFHPASGAFTERVQRLLRVDGELAGLIQGQVESGRRTLEALFVQRLSEGSALHAGPGSAGAGG